jgi:hypothetical protein
MIDMDRSNQGRGSNPPARSTSEEQFEVHVEEGFSIQAISETLRCIGAHTAARRAGCAGDRIGGPL